MFVLPLVVATSDDRIQQSDDVQGDKLVKVITQVLDDLIF